MVSIEDGYTICVCGKDFVIRFAGRNKTCACKCVGVRIFGIDAPERGQRGKTKRSRALRRHRQGHAVRPAFVTDEPR